jgi:hypothetical protein
MRIFETILLILAIVISLITFECIPILCDAHTYESETFSRYLAAGCAAVCTFSIISIYEVWR